MTDRLVSYLSLNKKRDETARSMMGTPGIEEGVYPSKNTMSLVQESVAISSEVPPPQDPVRKDKKHRVHPRPGALTKRPPPRPYKKIAQETLCDRIKKLSARMERAKNQVANPKSLLYVCTGEHSSLMAALPELAA